MRNKLQNYQERALKDLTKIKGGAEDVPIDIDKLRRSKRPKKIS